MPDGTGFAETATTPFRRRVYGIVCAIPPGQTRTYREVAVVAGSPLAARAVGTAMAENRFAPLIPCHRVVGSDGALHGYGGGLKMKQALLLREKGDSMSGRPHLVIISGMSGAGRSLAAKALEDVGFFVIDNLPAGLISDVVARPDLKDGAQRRLAVVVDTRGGPDFLELEQVINRLGADGVVTTVLFLDADDDVLAKRFAETRRPHPVPGDTIAESIAAERLALGDLRGRADVIIDTSDRNVHELREAVTEVFSGASELRPMRITIASFGFKHGVPRVVDLVFDVRFLRNPHWEERLRPLTGLDPEVRVRTEESRCR